MTVSIQPPLKNDIIHFFDEHGRPLFAKCLLVNTDPHLRRAFETALQKAGLAVTFVAMSCYMA